MPGPYCREGAGETRRAAANAIAGLGGPRDRQHLCSVNAQRAP